MITDLRTYLTHRFGESALTSRGAYAFELQRACEHEAVFDPYNRRIKLYGVEPAEFEHSWAEMLTGAGADPRLCSKVTVYALPGDDPQWESLGLKREGVITGFFSAGVDAVLWARYTDPDRGRSGREAEHEKIVEMARGKQFVHPGLPQGYTCRLATERDAAGISRLLGSAFDDYPTPTGEAAIAGLIGSGSHRFRIVRGPDGDVLAAASAELDLRRSSAEMTDCVTAPEHRGKGLMACLIDELARDVALSMGIVDVYSLCRADEPGINCVLGKLGYSYTGTLVNNCRMPNGWESMNVWCKTLRGLEPGA